MDSKDRMDSISEDTASQINWQQKTALSPLKQVLSSLKLIVDSSNSQEDTFLILVLLKQYLHYI